MSGLLVVGTVLAVAAITINAGRRDVVPPPDTSETTRAAEEPVPAIRGNTALEGDMEMAESAKTYGSVDHANDADFQAKVIDAEGPVLVDFYADWCGPCRMIAPALVELAREEPAARIIKVNVDDSPNVAAHYRIESIPALMVFENGQPVKRQLGVMTKDQLRNMLGL